MKRCLTITTLLVCVLAACAVQAEPVKLAYKFTAGEVDKHRINMSMNMTMPNVPGAASLSPISMTMDMVAQQRTLEVMPDGSAKVRVTCSAPKVTMTGGPKTKNPYPARQGFSMIQTVTPDGRITSVEGLEKVFAASGLKNFDMSPFTDLMGQYAFLPADPVEVGANWKQTVPIPFGGGQMTVDSVLESYGERIWSQVSARINQKYTGHMDIGQIIRSAAGSFAVNEKDRQMISQLNGSMDLNGTMTFDFAPAIGKVLKGNGQMWATVKIDMPAAAVKQGAPSETSLEMNIQMSLTRFK